MTKASSRQKTFSLLFTSTIVLSVEYYKACSRGKPRLISANKLTPTDALKVNNIFFYDYFIF